MDEVWCGLDLQLQGSDIAGLGVYRASDLHDHDAFWPALADCAASFLADVDLQATKVDDDVAAAMDTAGFLADNDHRLIMQHDATQTSSSLSSSKRSLSIDSGGSSSAFFPLDDAAALAAATAGIIFSSPARTAAAPASAPQGSFATAGDDAAIMRAMMAVLSSASPSSSESSSPPLCRDTSTVQAAEPVQPRGGNVQGHVKVRSSSLALPPERTTSLTGAASVGRQQQEDASRAAQGSNNSSQMYHMMSERKRREKLNDSFQTLRSLLPPCSKKDKTTVLINAASYLKALESQVSELEGKNDKLERHVPCEDGGGARAAAAAAHLRAKVQISRAAAPEDQVDLTVMVMVECDIVDLVLHVLERLRWMSGVSVLSVDADTYSPRVLLKAIASIKLQITDGGCWDEASFREAMTKAVHDATTASPSCAPAPLVAAA